MYRLFVNGEEIEMSYDTKISVSRKIFDLSDISVRGVQFTNAFTIPVTAKNLRLTGNPQVLSSNNNAFEKTVPYALEDNTSLVSSGQLIVKEFDEKKGIKVQLSEGADFWGLIEGLELKDLVLDAFDFEFTNANMDAKITLASNDIFVTALHNAGDPDDTALVSYNKTRPFFRFRPILDAIASRAGYTINYNNVLTDTELNLVGCASNADRFVFSDFRLRFQQQVFLGQLDLPSGVSEFDLGHVTVSGNQMTNTLYKTSYVLKGTFTASVPSTVRFVFNDRVESFLIPIGTTTQNFISDESEIGSTLIIETSENVFLENVLLYTHITETEIFDVDQDFTAVFGFFVLSDYNLPEITCKDFMKIVMKMFFLNVTTDNLKREIEFTRFVDALNTNNVVNLSNGVVRNNSWSTGEVYGKINYLAYANDENVDVDLGRATFLVENINAPEINDFITIDDFSASEQTLIDGETVVSYNIYPPPPPVTDPPTEPDISRDSLKDRIVFFNQTGDFGINATFFEISFNRLYSNHYFQFVENTIRERVITFKAFLTFQEFSDIQRRPLILEPDLGGLYLVTDIEGYTEDGLTTLKCVKYG